MSSIKKLSAVVITYNEEKHIARCIDSLTQVADEILVIDSFSTDSTKEICLLKGVKFIENTFEGHIEQKNFAAKSASHDFVLSLDADEELSEELIAFILREKAHFKSDAYKFNRLNNYCGQWIKHCGWYPDKKIRLWNKQKGKWGGTNPHDKIVLDKNATIQYHNADIKHYTFQNLNEHVDQIHYFTTISASASYQKGKKVRIFKIVLSPFTKFIHCYVFQLGFLDGFFGFVICINNGYYSFLENLKLWDLHQKAK